VDGRQTLPTAPNLRRSEIRNTSSRSASAISPRERGVRLLSASDGQNLTEETDEITEGVVTIMAVFAQIEKKRLVKKAKSSAGS
jgi:hypothetical protein